MKSIYAALLLLLCVTACSGDTVLSEPPIEFDPNYLNRQIHLIDVKGWPRRTNAYLAFVLEYNATNVIVFPGDYNLRAFIQQDGGWAEIQERPMARPQEPVVLSPDNATSYDQIIGFWPQFSDLSKTYYLRIYVFGDMRTPDGVRQVGAYVDLVITP